MQPSDSMNAREAARIVSTQVIPIAARSGDPRPAAPGRQSGSPGVEPLLRTTPGDLPKASEQGPEIAAFPFGPNICAWLEKWMPIAVYGATCVQRSDENARRAKELAEVRS